MSENKTRGAQRTRWPVFENQKQASAWLGCPLATIKRAKDAGCKAFLTHGRIDAGLLAPFVLSQTAESDGGLRDPAQEKAALDAARRREIERREKLELGEMHILSDIEQKVWADTLAPAREGIMNLSRICAAPCNPQDVATATKVLDAYAARILKTVNDAVPAEMKGDE